MNESPDPGDPNGPGEDYSTGAKAAATSRPPLPGVAFRPDASTPGQWSDGWRVADEPQCVCR